MNSDVKETVIAIPVGSFVKVKKDGMERTGQTGTVVDGFGKEKYLVVFDKKDSNSQQASILNHDWLVQVPSAEACPTVIPENMNSDGMKHGKGTAAEKVDVKAVVEDKAAKMAEALLGKVDKSEKVSPEQIQKLLEQLKPSMVSQAVQAADAYINALRECHTSPAAYIQLDSLREQWEAYKDSVFGS